MNDSRGVLRGRCKDCTSCCGYCLSDSSSGLKCSLCGCPPGKHIKTSITEVQVEDADCGSHNATVGAVTYRQQGQIPNAGSMIPASQCVVHGCFRSVKFDINTGIEHDYCSAHHHGHHNFMVCEDIEDETEMDYESYSADMDIATPKPSQNFTVVKDATMCILPDCYTKKYTDNQSGQVYDYCGKTHAEEGRRRQISNSPGQQPVVSTGSGPICAIQECGKPCFKDESGKFHSCCGITHALEHQRRQALWNNVNQQVVKGVTHCLLPECNNQTWPFQNYCGRSHADIGKQRGLIPPPPPATSTGPKDNSLCIIPGCQKTKYVDQSTNVTHDYCGKTCADIGKARGIFATSDKVEEQCDMPGCSNKKKTEAGRTYDYCCCDHAQKDAANRDVRMLTSMAEVQKFLKKFPSLKVVKLEENNHAKPGGSLFNKFKKAMMSLPSDQRNTCLAFHGTAERNIQSICSNGYDPKLRAGQAMGPGEYFAVSPHTPMGYCKGGKKMLLNELLLGKSGTHHTKHGDVVVMKYPEHDLPRFVVTFQ